MVLDRADACTTPSSRRRSPHLFAAQLLPDVASSFFAGLLLGLHHNSHHLPGTDKADSAFVYTSSFDSDLPPIRSPFLSRLCTAVAALILFTCINCWHSHPIRRLKQHRTALDWIATPPNTTDRGRLWPAVPHTVVIENTLNLGDTPSLATRALRRTHVPDLEPSLSSCQESRPG